MLAYGAGHRLEVVAVADGDSLEPNVAGYDQTQPRLHRSAGQHADHTDRSAGTNRPQRLGQRALAADLDDVVDADVAGDLAGALAPARNGPIVDHGIGAEPARPLQLAVAGRSDDNEGAQQLRELQREQRDPAGF